MLINCDVKALEICAAAFLSKDAVMIKEIRDGVDIHADNQVRFSLPTRLIAKTLVFRILYGGSEFSFAKDPEFSYVSNKPAFWANVIENFYTKYKDLKKWHSSLMDNVMLTGLYRSPTGREYTFKPYPNDHNEWKWPRTNILNYPVQGFGADLVRIMNVSLWYRIRKLQLDIKPLAVVHDSILLDVKREDVNQTVKLLHDVARDVPGNFLKLFGVLYELPFQVEVKVGNNYQLMEKENITHADTSG